MVTAHDPVIADLLRHMDQQARHDAEVAARERFLASLSIPELYDRAGMSLEQLADLIDATDPELIRHWFLSGNSVRAFLAMNRIKAHLDAARELAWRNEKDNHARL